MEAQADGNRKERIKQMIAETQRSADFHTQRIAHHQVKLIELRAMECELQDDLREEEKKEVALQLASNSASRMRTTQAQKITDRLHPAHPSV